METFSFIPTMWLTTSCHMTECQHRRILGVCVLPNISVARYYFCVGSRYRIFMLVGLCSIICEGDFIEETRLCPISCCPVGPRHPRRNTGSFCQKLRPGCLQYVDRRRRYTPEHRKRRPRLGRDCLARCRLWLPESHPPPRPAIRRQFGLGSKEKS